MSPWIKGADLSTLAEVEACGGRFYDRDGREDDALRILTKHGVNLIRLRLWNDPFSAAGEPYGGGGCDLNRVRALARRVKALGLDWQLDFHYSDFWADPGKQTLPKAWKSLSSAKLEAAVYAYTCEVLRLLCAEGLQPAQVSVGNEITNGLLWPWGKVPHWAQLTRFLKAGIRAVRDVSPASAVLLHLDNGGNAALYRDWFDHYEENRGEAFDWIGLSYYPYWSGTLDGLAANMDALARRYGKPLLITETSMGFSLEPWQTMPNKRTVPESSLPYPMTPDGQCRFLKDLAEVIRKTPDGLGRGFVWWEPTWLPVPGSGWAEPAALDYLGAEGPGGNEWANQALFSYDGRALPALDTLKTL